MNQVPQKSVAKPRFTKAQLEEQRQFVSDLENGSVDIVFKGTFGDGISFLKETGKLVDTFNHA